MRMPPRAPAPLPLKCLLVACITLSTLVIGPHVALGASQVRVDRDVPVPTTGGGRITVDVWRVPSSKAQGNGRRAATRNRQRKVALLIHGGGWHSGDKRQWEQSRWAQRLVKNGWLVVNANYRLACTARVSRKERAARDNRLCGHAMRESIADVHSALRFTARRARAWGGDPKRIVLFGASAGGHLAMIAGSHARRPRGVRAVVAIGPPTDLTWVGRQPAIPLYQSARQSIGCDLDACPGLWRTASPISMVRSGTTPPTWVFNAEHDPITAIEPIRAYLARLRDRGIATHLTTPLDPNADCHGPIPCQGQPVANGNGDMFQTALTWLRSYV